MLRRALIAMAICSTVLALTAQAQAGATSMQATARPPMAAEMRVAELPTGAAQRHAELQAHLQPSAQSWVMQQARAMKGQKSPDLGALRAAATARFAANGGATAASNAAIDQMVFAVLMESTKDSENDLRDAMQQMQAITRAKDQIRGMQQATRQAAGNTAGQAVCRTAFCDSLPKQLAELNAELPPRARVSVQAHKGNVSSVDLREISAALGNSENSLTEMSSEQQMKLQMLMDERAKAMQTLSNLMKSMSDTSAGIVSNLK